MRITIRYFAAAREAVGRDTEVLDLDREATVSEVHALLEARYPSLADIHLRFAVGQAFADSDHLLRDHDEVALIPPVSGG